MPKATLSGKWQRLKSRLQSLDFYRHAPSSAIDVIRPLSPLLVLCPSGYLFPTYTYFLENQQILREGRVLPDKASAGLQKKGVHNNIQQCQLPILTYTVSLPSASLRNECRLRERGGEKRSHFSENGETDQYNGLATSPKCLSYISSELKIRSYLVC